MYKIYEFRCPNCLKIEEVLIDDPKNTMIVTCVGCNREMEKILSATRGYVK